MAEVVGSIPTSSIEPLSGRAIEDLGAGRRRKDMLTPPSYPLARPKSLSIDIG